MLVEELPAVDYTQILPIQQKRTITFINHFIMNTVSFLNNLAQSCESRLMEFEYKLQKVEASLKILESQLASIPDLEITETKTNNVSDIQVKNDDNNANHTFNNEGAVNASDINSTNESKSNQLKASEDPRFIKFFKMLQVGVPSQAVKLKMQIEGVDPNILDFPDIPAGSPQEHEV